jgi:hypothetical protein
MFEIHRWTTNETGEQGKGVQFTVTIPIQRELNEKLSNPLTFQSIHQLLARAEVSK